MPVRTPVVARPRRLWSDPGSPPTRFRPLPDDDPQQPAPGAGARREFERRRDARLRAAADRQLRPPSAWEEGYRKGAEGEATAGARLDAAARAVGGVATLHDLVLPGERSNSVAAALIGATASTVREELRPMSGAALRARSAELRQVAAAAAGGRVRGPRVTTTDAVFHLTYRRGRRCRVRLTVLRAPGSRHSPPAVEAAGCAARR